MKSKVDSHIFADRTGLGIRLKWWRGRNELKIEAAAGQLGVSTATWGHWETGHTFPSGEMLLNLSELTGLPLQMLFCPHVETCPFLPTNRDTQEPVPRCPCSGKEDLSDTPEKS